MNLLDLGWQSGELPANMTEQAIARITCVHRGLCLGMTIEGPIKIHLSGRFLYELDSDSVMPATGDFVSLCPPFHDEHGHLNAVLKEILPRRSKISRLAPGSKAIEQVLAANVDFAFIVCSANDDFSVSRIQRYILLANEGLVTPIVIISKSDLMAEYQSLIADVKTSTEHIEVLPLSSIQNFGIESIKSKITVGKTAVFIGSSGVGKSTLVNRLLGEDVQATKDIRTDDAKGRHTTSSRELFFLKDGGMIIDTAGLREVQVFAAIDALDDTFKSVVEFIHQCKFSNCSHQTESGCAVQKALVDGLILTSDLKNYYKLQRELSFSEQKIDKAKAANSKKRWKQINKDYRAQKNFKGK